MGVRKFRFQNLEFRLISIRILDLKINFSKYNIDFLKY